MATVRPFAAATIEREAVNPDRLELGSKLGSAQGSLSYSHTSANPLLFASGDHVISASFALIESHEFLVYLPILALFVGVR
jgi:hypothetical protein